MIERQAFALDTLVHEVNVHAPGRSKVSDGGRASAAHHLANPTSDHEPNAAGVWTAYDFTNDPAHLPGRDLATRLAAHLGHHPAMKAGAYVIWDRHIISFNRLNEGWRTYTGTDPHTSHVHLSVSDAAAGYDSRQPWNLWTTQAGSAEKSSTTDPLVAFRNRFNEDRLIDLNLLDQITEHGTPHALAAAAKLCKYAAIEAVRAFLRGAQ